MQASKQVNTPLSTQGKSTSARPCHSVFRPNPKYISIPIMLAAIYLYCKSLAKIITNNDVFERGGLSTLQQFATPLKVPMKEEQADESAQQPSYVIKGKKHDDNDVESGTKEKSP